MPPAELDRADVAHDLRGREPCARAHQDAGARRARCRRGTSTRPSASRSSRTIAASPTSRSTRSCSWVDGGAPQGDPKDMPPPATFAGSERLAVRRSSSAQPDLVIKSPPYTLAARTQDTWCRPVDRHRAHRAALGARDRDPAGRPERPQDHPPRARRRSSRTRRRHHRPRAAARTTCRRRPACSWNGPSARRARSAPRHRQADAARLEDPLGHPHYAIGEEINDSQVELGIYFYPKGQEPKHRTVLRDVRRQPRLASSTSRRTRQR